MTAVPQVLQQSPRTVYGLPEGEDARFLAARARELMPEDRVLLHIAQDDVRMAALKELLAFFAPDVEVVEFPGLGLSAL